MLEIKDYKTATEKETKDDFIMSIEQLFYYYNKLKAKEDLNFDEIQALEYKGDRIMKIAKRLKKIKELKG